MAAIWACGSRASIWAGILEAAGTTALRGAILTSDDPATVLRLLPQAFAEPAAEIPGVAA